MQLRRSKKWLFTVAALTALSLLAAACGGDGDDGDSGDGGPATVKLAFAFPPDISMPGYFVSEELGFFEDENLTVELQIVDGTSSVIQQVVAGQADVGVGGPPSALYLAGVEGAEAVSFYQIDQENIFAIVVPEDSDIQSVEDLAGKTLGISDFSGGEVPVVRAALGLADLEEGADVELLPIGDSPPTVSQALQSGEVDAYAGGDATTLGLQSIGVVFRNVLQDEFQELPGNIAIASADFAEENQDILARFARAFAKGTYYAAENFDEALQIGCDFAPENCEDENFAELAMDYYVNLQQPLGEDYGEINVAGWEAAYDILVQEGELEDGYDWERHYDSSVIEEANDFDKEEVASAGS
jgi:ABC-type nitrate/sulfonate/bicarbonate transport system substrate-binding protein